MMSQDDAQRIFQKLDILAERVTRVTTILEERSRPCVELTAHLESHENQKPAVWDMVFRAAILLGAGLGGYLAARYGVELT